MMGLFSIWQNLNFKSTLAIVVNGQILNKTSAYPVKMVSDHLNNHYFENAKNSLKGKM